MKTPTSRNIRQLEHVGYFNLLHPSPNSSRKLGVDGHIPASPYTTGAHLNALSKMILTKCLFKLSKPEGEAWITAVIFIIY